MLIEKLKKLTDLSFVVLPFRGDEVGYISIQFVYENKKERTDIYFEDASQFAY